MPVHKLAKIGLLAIVVAVLASLSIVDTLGRLWRTRSPQAAQSLPFETQAPLLVMSSGLLTRKEPLPRDQVFTLARRAIASDPLNPVAFRMMALASDPETSSRESIGYARLADRLSRRDLFVQLILIEEAVRNNNVPEALSRYDQALRTSLQSREFLLPILSEALANAEISKGLERYYVAGAPWFETFISYAAQNAKAGEVADLLFHAGPRKNPVLLNAVAPTLLTRLVEQREYSRADRLFSALPGSNRALLERAEWTGTSVDQRFGAFAWQPLTAELASAGFETTAARSTPEFYLYVRSGTEAKVLSKVLALRPGAYRLGLSMSVDVRGPGARAWWTLQCLDAGGARQVWESQDILGLKPEELIAGPTVTADCRYQVLELWARGGEGQDGLDLQIQEFRMTTH